MNFYEKVDKRKLGELSNRFLLTALVECGRILGVGIGDVYDEAFRTAKKIRAILLSRLEGRG